MAELTQAEVLAYNKKITQAKEKAAEDKARKDLAHKELLSVCEELSELLGKPITPENLEDEYAIFTSEAMKIMESGNTLLAGLENEKQEAILKTQESPLAEVVGTQTTSMSAVSGGDGVDIDDLFGLD